MSRIESIQKNQNEVDPIWSFEQVKFGSTLVMKWFRSHFDKNDVLNALALNFELKGRFKSHPFISCGKKTTIQNQFWQNFPMTF